MNIFTAAAKFVRRSDIRHVGDNQTAVINLTLELLAKYGSNESFTIDSVAWGKTAEQIANMDEGSIAFVAGQLNILKVDRGEYKESIASFKIEEIILPMDTLIPFNIIGISGNVGQDVDVRYFDSGKNNAKFTLAVRRGKDDPDWFPIEIWGAPAKVAEQYVEKGSKVSIKGHLKQETWTDKKTGEVRTKPVVVADQIGLEGKNQVSESSSETAQSTSQLQSSNWSDTKGRPAIDSKWEHSRHDPHDTEPDFDDIPF